MRKKLLSIGLLLISMVLSANQGKGGNLSLTSGNFLGDAVETPVKLYGFLSSASRPAIYSFDAAEPLNLEMVYTGSRLSALSTGVYAEGKYYAFTPEYDQWGRPSGLKYTVFDGDDWSILLEKDLGASSVCPNLLTFDPVNKKIYGCMLREFYEVDKETGAMSSLFTIEDCSFRLLVTDAYGVTYGIDAATGDLKTVNMQTREVKTINNIAIAKGLNSPQAGTIDYLSGRCFWAYVANWDNTKNKLVEVNLKDATITDIANFTNSEVFRGALFTKNEISHEDALVPDVVKDLEVTYKVSGKCDATFKLTTPEKAFDKKTALQEKLAVTFYVDNEEVGTKENIDPGSEVSYDYTLSPGLHWISVMASNSKGNSPQVQVKTFAGFDTPGIVANVLLKVNDTKGEYTLTWDAPSERGVNNGMIDIQNAKYLLTCYPDHGIVANEIAGTTYTGTFPTTELKDYYFSVTVICGEKKSEEAFSNHQVYGESVRTPYTEDFQTTKAWNLFTIIDDNKDQNTWGYDEKQKCISYSGNDYEASEWLFTPAIKMRKGITYTLKFTYSTALFGTCNLAVWCSKGIDSSRLPNENMVSLLSLRNNQAQERTDKIVTYVPEEDGIYHFAFQCFNDPNQNLYVWSYDITASAAPDAPAEVEELKITPGEAGKLEATITFKVPVLTMEGNPLSDGEITSVVIYRGQSLNSVKVFERPEKGVVCSYTDTEAVQGMNDYRVVVYSEKGNNAGISSTAWIGEDFAKPVPAFSVALTDEDFVFTWEKPTGGINDGYIDYENMIYTIFYFINNLFEDYYPLVSGLKGSTHSIPKAEFDHYLVQPQISLSFAVVAVTSAGNSGSPTYFDMVYGRSYSLPFAESFADGLFVTEPWGVIVLNGDVAWTRVGGSPISSVSPYDNDRGMAMFYQNSSESSEGRLLSPEISVKGAVNPQLSFGMFHRSVSDKANNYLQVEVKKDNNEYVAVGDPIPVDDGSNGWKEHKLSLKDIGAEQFRLSFHGKADVNVNFYIDAIQLSEQTTPVEYPRITDLQGMLIDNDTKVKLTWSAPEGFGNLSLLGYYIYCDGEKIMDNYITECTYTIALEDQNPHVYAVSIVFNEGDSPLSNEVYIAPVGMENRLLEKVDVYVSGHTIHMEGNNKRFRVYTVTGKEIYDSLINGQQSLDVNTGVYLVKAGERVHKCIIR